MSLLLIEIVSEGMIFGADRNVTHIYERLGVSKVEIHGQSQRTKVLRWPNRRALIGYVGAAEIGGLPTDEWLYEFIGDNLEFQSFREMAFSLSGKVQEQRYLDEKGSSAELLILHLGGFEKREGVWVPSIWHIRNTHGTGANEYLDVKKDFLCTEVEWPWPTQEQRTRFGERAQSFDPFWIHQTEDLGTFNTIEAFLKAAFKVLCEQGHGTHAFPSSLSEWERQVKMSILTYSAYFQAYKGPGEQLVGGGADTVSLKWP